MTILARLRSVPDESSQQGLPGFIALEDDYHGWAQQQAAFLSSGEVDRLDLANLAEEIAELARSEFRSLSEAYHLLLLNILRWDHSQAKRTRQRWRAIELQRERVKDLLIDNPSMSQRLDEAGARGYRKARLKAAQELALSLDEIPETCPYCSLSILSRRFEPG